MATIESVKRACITLYRNHFDTHLKTVFDNWTEIDSIPLPSIGQYIYGDLAGTQMPNQYPALMVLSGRVREVTKYQSNVSEWEVAIAIRIHLQHTETETLSKTVDRFFEATMLLLQAYPKLDGEIFKDIYEIEGSVSSTEPWQSVFVKGLQVGFWAPFIGPS